MIKNNIKIINNKLQNEPHPFVVIEIKNGIATLVQLSHSYKTNVKFSKNNSCLLQDSYLVNDYKYVIDVDKLTICKNLCHKKKKDSWCCFDNNGEHKQYFNKESYEITRCKMINKEIIEIILIDFKKIKKNNYF